MAGAWPLPGEGSRLRPEGRGPGGPPGSETVRELSQASKTATTAEQRTQAELTTRTVSGKQWTNPGSTRACAGAGLGPVRPGPLSATDLAPRPGGRAGGKGRPSGTLVPAAAALPSGEARPDLRLSVPARGPVGPRFFAVPK